MQFVRPKQRYYRKPLEGPSSSKIGSRIGASSSIGSNISRGSGRSSTVTSSFASSISVLLASAATGHGMKEVLDFVDSFHAEMSQTGALPGELVNVCICVR